MNKKWLLLVAALLALVPSWSQASGLCASACGKARWEVKVGMDLDAPRIAVAPVVDTTIFDLTQIPAPINPNIRRNTRYAPTELTVYRIHATLTLIKPEKDGDYHMVITDQKGRTMIIESADPSCATGSRFEAQIWLVRDTIDRHFKGKTTSKREIQAPVTVTGVGFFDHLHGQSGAAPNEIELHPLLEISFD
jgi:hypothetical protein